MKTSGINKVIVVGGYYSLTEELPEIINRNGFVASDIDPFVIDNSGEEGKLQKYADELGYLFLSKRNAFCVDTKCDYFDGKKVPFTYDKHHLSVEFATRIAQGSRREFRSIWRMPVSQPSYRLMNQKVVLWKLLLGGRIRPLRARSPMFSRTEVLVSG